MSKAPPIYVDTDVIISSLFSSTGASYEIINNKKYSPKISNHSKKEVLKVTKRFNIPKESANKVFRKIGIENIPTTIKKVREKYLDYVSDSDDGHVVAGAVHCKCLFLITFNIKHFKVEKIQKELGITVIQPGKYLQSFRLD